jgi:3-hydroxybutyryl-CoA dehydrogenase
MGLKTIGVVGAGVMGCGLSQHLAQAGFQVVLIDISENILEQARSEIRQNLRFQRLFQKDGTPESADEILGRVRFSTDNHELESSDFVIENAVEKWNVKRDIYRDIDTLCPEHCIFACNTSAIPITRIGSVTQRPDRIIGMHFMNPVPLKKTVELIRGRDTSDKTVEKAKDFLTLIQKDFVLVNDSPGFVSNRVLMLTVNEAIYLLQDEVASAEDVDRIFKSCFGHPMGPLETADLIGLDTILYSLDVLCDSFNDTKYRPCPLLKDMVDNGLHGRKSGRGFYNY